MQVAVAASSGNGTLPWQAAMSEVRERALRATAVRVCRTVNKKQHVLLLPAA